MAGLRIRFGEGQLEPSLQASFQEISDLGVIPTRVSDYLANGEVDPQTATDDLPGLQKSMWGFLQNRGAVLDSDAKFAAGDYDEMLFAAYDNALRSKNGSASDPLQAARNGGSPAAMQGWDFTVDTFETVEEQGVLAESIRAAGALDYVFELGERLRVFDLAEQLVLKWASGEVDIAEGPAAGKLYRYFKLLDDRATPQERAMLYRRVLNKGNATPLGGAVVNDQFPVIWGKLMAEIAEYIEKSEKLDSGGTDGSPVSARPIGQALRELQYNLTDHCTGMAFMQVREMYAQLNQAFDIFRDPDVIASFGGVRRRNMWTVISELSKQAFGAAPPVSPIVRMAVDGNRIFQAASVYDDGTFSPTDYGELIQAGESYIINSSMVGEEPQFEETDELEKEGEFEDEFEDF